ncbi:hypothetical protein ACRALDRAFT_206310 [Sodiomyces alcalophilus JCM 7366]|uniref:uncharacterized protein n=1 Tax=Sodiomyces alcalophilus JCM 7366 TaxID=591952 RepID=UPI0039B4B64E
MHVSSAWASYPAGLPLPLSLHIPLQHDCIKESCWCSTEQQHHVKKPVPSLHYGRKSFGLDSTG